MDFFFNKKKAHLFDGLFYKILFRIYFSAHAYELISKPTEISANFGLFQAILYLHKLLIFRFYQVNINVK